MPTRTLWRHPLSRYGAAIAISVLALLLAWALDPLLGAGPFALFLGAVMLSAWYGGLGPGLLATGLCALAVDYFFENPANELGVSNLDTLAELLVFVVIATLISSLNANLRAARRRAELAQHDAERAVRQRDELLALISHDLRNPLTAIDGYVQLLQRRVLASGSAEATRLLEGLARVEDSTHRMRRLMDELVDVARLQAGSPLSLERRTVDLVELVGDAVAAQQHATDAHSIRVQCAEPRLMGDWDAPRLERVLENLLSNAVKYSPAGGEILVTLARRADEQGALAELRVTDPGIGIPAAELPRLFERFYRASNAHGHMPGIGLGLAGARELVELHGGTIGAESVEGRGSTFTVRLPLAPEPALAAVPRR